MQLRITAGPDAGKTIEPAGEHFTIGREGVDFLLADDEVSRQHLEIRTMPGGRIEVADLGSRNGTRVNGERISEPRALNGGEEITVGTTTIVVEGPPPVAETVVGGEIPTSDETVIAGEPPVEEPDPDATAVGVPAPAEPPAPEPPTADEPTVAPPPGEPPATPPPAAAPPPTAPLPADAIPTPPPEPAAAVPPPPAAAPPPSPPAAAPPRPAAAKAPPAFTQRPGARAGGESAALWKRVTALVLSILLGLAAIIFAIVAIDLSGTPICGSPDVGFLEECYLGTDGEKTLGIVLLGLGVISSIAFLVFSIYYFAKSRGGWLALATGVAAALLFTVGLIVG